MQPRYTVRLRDDRFQIFDRLKQQPVCFRDTLPEARHAERTLNDQCVLTLATKAQRMHDALDQLAGEIANSAVYDAPTAVLAFNAIDTFNREASVFSKARFYDIIKGA